MEMRLIKPSQDWASLYFEKRGKHNQFSQFKTKAYIYQKYYAKLMLPKHRDDEQGKYKQTKLSISKLQDLHEQLKNIFCQIQQELSFMKFQTLSSLVQNIQEMFSTMHDYFVKNLTFHLREPTQNITTWNQNNDDLICKKCKINRQKITLQQAYKEISLTIGQIEPLMQMTKQERLKMVTSFDEYDILLAEKDNYIRKVDQILQNKDKIGLISNKQKNNNYLADYLTHLEQIYQKKVKKDANQEGQILQTSRNWEEESYQQILEYMKGVLYDHFVSQSSSPAQKIFQKINLDKIFRSFKDKEKYSCEKKVHMKNNESQTIEISEFTKLKNLQKSYEFCQKQIKTIKQNKEVVQKKYLVLLQQNRKSQNELTGLKYEVKSLQNKVLTSYSQIQQLRLQSKQLKEQGSKQKISLIQNHVKEKQRILRVSRKIQTQFQILAQEHSKCESQKGKLYKKVTQHQQKADKLIQVNLQNQSQKDIQVQDAFSKTEMTSSKKKRDIRDKTKYSSFIQRKSVNYPQQLTKGQDSLIFQENPLNQQKSSKFLILNHIIEYKICQNQQLNQADSVAQQEQRVVKPIVKKSKFATENSIKKNNKDQYYQNQKMESSQIKAQKNKLSMQYIKNKKNTKDSKVQNSYRNLPKLRKQSNRFTQSNQIIKKIDVKNSQNSIDYIGKNGKHALSQRHLTKTLGNQPSQNHTIERIVQNNKQKFYIKKISRNLAKFKFQKEKLKQISQILKPYAYTNNVQSSKSKRSSYRKRLSSIVSNYRSSRSSLSKFNLKKQRLSFRKQAEQLKEQQIPKSDKQHQIELTTIGCKIIQIQNIIQAEFSYLKAVGFIDFLQKIGLQKKKSLKTNQKMPSKKTIRKLDQSDLSLFGGREQALIYLKKKEIWSTVDQANGLIIYYKNDNLSTKVQKYMNLLKKTNPQIYTNIIDFLVNPILAIMGQKVFGEQINTKLIYSKQNYVKEVFNNIQMYHKIKHKDCTHVTDFLERIGFYRYTYF